MSTLLLRWDKVRGVKDAEEQTKMRIASDINDRAMEEFRKLIREGVTEREVADQMLEIYMKLGADGFSSNLWSPSEPMPRILTMRRTGRFFSRGTVFSSMWDA